MHRIFCKRRLNVLMILIAAAGAGMIAANRPAAASSIPDNAIYGDVFASPGTRGRNLTHQSPQVNKTHQVVTYSGQTPKFFSVSTVSVKNRINDGKTGVVTASPSTRNDITLLLPIPNSASTKGYVIQTDLVPFDKTGQTDSRNTGIVLTFDADANYYSAGDNIRIGIGGKSNQYLGIQQKHGINDMIPVGQLHDYAARNWNQLRVEIKPDGGASVFFNGQKVKAYEAGKFKKMDSINYAGLDALSMAGGAKAYFDNFALSPVD